MLSSYTVTCIFVFLVAVSIEFCSGQEESDEVTCMDLQEVCECNANECNFRLNISELQTFTSYYLENGTELTEGAAGFSYYVDGSGYHPSPRLRIMPCYMETQLVNDSDFRSQNCSVPMTVDGKTYRLFIAVNGRIPGPTLIVNEGAVVRVSVHNRLTSEGITIHWHGMHQKDTPWMDGVGFISQAPITPGATFDYVFKATPAGTHWYHSHVGAQRTDGLFGALIVRENNNQFETDIVPALLEYLPEAVYTSIADIPGRHTMTLLDWQREASLDLFVRIHPALGFYDNITDTNAVPDGTKAPYTVTQGPDSTEIGPIPYWSGLINGKGRHTLDDPSPLSVFPVAANKAYRFRVIGAQSVYAYSLSIDAHKLTVIATDGHFIEPITVDFLIVHSGERYDFILETMDTSEGSYWIRTETLETDTPREHSARAILKYGSENDTNVDWRNVVQNIPNSPNLCTAEQCDVLNCPFLNYPVNDNKNCISLTDLSPLNQLPVQSKPCDELNDCTSFFNFGFKGIGTTSAINGRNFKLPVTPYQTTCGRYDEDREDCSQCSENNSQGCRCVHVEEIMSTKTFSKADIETQIMVFSALGEKGSENNSTDLEFAHPVHLHGHSFHVVYAGYGEYDVMNEFIKASMDIDCGTGDGDLTLCKEPRWRNGIVPDQVAEAIYNTSTHILKDTVIVPAGGYVVVAFPADNPGYWFLHCHIEVHQLEGMGVLIEEYSSVQHKGPPEGINNIGNFRWEINDYNSFVKENKKCIIQEGSINNPYKDAVIGLGIILAIAIIIIACLCVYFYRNRKSSNFL